MIMEPLPIMCDAPLQVGEVGVLQNLKRTSLNGLVAEVTGELRQRMLYSITNPADSEICMSYRVRIPGYPPVSSRIEWCVKQFQLRRIDDPDFYSREKAANTEDGVITL